MKLDWIEIEKILNGTASEKDVVRFDAWLNQSKIHQQQFEKIRAFNDNCDNEEYQRSTLRGKKHSPMQIINKTRRIRMIKYSVSVAAAFIAVTFLINSLNQIDPIKNESFEVAVSGIKSNEIVIKTETGSVLELTKLNANVDLNTKKIAYRESDNIEYHTICVPKGKKITLELSDGTEITINSDTEVKYPTKFEHGKPRELQLKGEAYFNVKKSVSPFIVNVNGNCITVYGTKFNVRAYDMAKTETVLIEGSVGVSIKDSKNSEILLKPNEKCLVNSGDSSFNITSVNPDKYVAWVSGYFKCERDQLGDFIEEISRWYGVEFVFENNAYKSISISAVYNRELALEEIISTIEKLLNIKFEKNERGYIIK